MTIKNKIRTLFKTDSNHSRAPVNDFDEQFYLEYYLDVARAQVNAYEHYVQFGKAEGRVPTPYTTNEGAIPYYVDKETILLVCHQASRTGAPILGLNLCQLLNNQYNVVVLLLDRGEILSFFKKNCFKLISFANISLATPHRLDTIIQSLTAENKIQFALINSVVGSMVLKPLAHSFIPSVLLIHEFFSYIRPIHTFNEALFWSGATIFPTQMLQSNGKTEVTQYAIEASHVLPQGKSYIPFDKTDQTHRGNTQLKSLLHTLENTDKKPFIILGAGSVEYRKGVDLFIATAEEIKRVHPTLNIKLLWVGHGFDPIHDAGYSCFLSHQIESTALHTHFEFINAVSDLEQLYRITDLFYFPARLDPLPNVIIDVMMLGIPTLCFEHGCGASEFLKQDKDTESCVLPFASTHSAVEKIIELYYSKSHYNLISEKVSILAREHFDMQRYANKIIEIGKSQHLVIEQEKYSFDLVNQTDSLSLSKGPHHLNCSTTIRRYVRSWYSQIYPLRKPVPGFNPYIYNHHLSPKVEPFADYLSNGAQDGPWKNELIIAENNTCRSAHYIQVALHIHMPQLHDLKDMLQRLSNIESQYDIFISTSAILQPHIEYILSANKANNCFVSAVSPDLSALNALFRDFGPKLKTYDLIGHMCSLQSLNENHVIDHNARQLFFLEHMIGGKYPLMDQIIEQFKRAPMIGMVFPDDPYLWMNDLKHATFNGPTAGMFWARTKAIESLFSCNNKTIDYSDISATVLDKQFKYATTHVIDITY